MNDTRQLEDELLVESNRPVRDEKYIAWLKQVISLANHTNKQLEGRP